jgi:polyferredoxin
VSAVKEVMVAMAKRKLIPFTARLARWRLWVQAAFLLVWLDPLLLRLHMVCSPVFHCYSCPLATFACPIGVLANFSALHVVPLLALGTLLVVGTLLGTFICGWVCPFGLLQDLAARVPTPKFRPPHWMTHFRYVVLVGLVLLVPYFFGTEHPLFFCRVCPAGAVEAALPHTVATAVSGGPVAWPSLIKGLVLAAFLVSMFFMWRPWCTLFCPLGAIFSLLNRTSVFFLRIDEPRCRDCDLCRKLCRYGGKSEKRASDMECIRCLDCTRCDVISVDHVFARQNRQPSPEKSCLDIAAK